MNTYIESRDDLKNQTRIKTEDLPEHGYVTKEDQECWECGETNKDYMTEISTIAMTGMLFCDDCLDYIEIALDDEDDE